MASLLHVDSAANTSDESITRRLTASFAAAWRDRHGPAAHRYRDLAAAPVPPLTTAFAELGRRVERHGLLPLDRVPELIESPAERREWELTEPLISEMRSADVVLIGAPMYNFSIPAALKAWIDRMTFPGAFGGPGSAQRPLHDTKVVVIMARGGAYGPGTPREGWDFQTPYLRTYFTEHGVREENLFFVAAELTVADFIPQLAALRPAAAGSLAAAEAEVTALAGRLIDPVPVHPPSPVPGG
ncbi:FMN-dependent NADH-azoreductase [Sphaerisporangium rufum]|uniref:FMN dependent NADH:quinone oxidoreductase n=1 Tax=Sphaerisporangium rufum TaxID=1381558 RepID=A0A919R5Q9_9ACTN|nr:NAD(P)H-dependent oxidoreductase [Sphaerisporangium rufum]GII80192.1 FMN-dependent NADH-azoreductase [Sphaerisporangium rufum]